jgi:hypothetical protein
MSSHISSHGCAALTMTCPRSAAPSCTPCNWPEKICESGAPVFPMQLSNARPAGTAPVAFHIRHIARSLDRLLTYAEGRNLNESQLAALRSELDPGAKRGELFSELATALTDGATRVRALAIANLEEARTVGKKQLPTTVGGLLVHVADHTQRHVGQAITTAKIVAGNNQ